MSVSFQCPGCGAKLVLDDSLAGQQVKCPKCNNTVTAPGPAGAPSPMGAQGTPQFGPPIDMAPAGGAKKPCPFCGETIEASAKKCKFCNEWLDPSMRPQQAAVSASDANLTAAEWIIAILCSGIGCIVGIVWMCQGKPKGKKMFLISLIAGIVGGLIRFAAMAAQH